MTASFVTRAGLAAVLAVLAGGAATTVAPRLPASTAGPSLAGASAGRGSTPASVPLAPRLGTPPGLPAPAGAAAAAAEAPRAGGRDGPARTTAGWPCRPRGARSGHRPAGAPRPYRCPVPGLPASLFDAPQTRYSAGHRGVDLLTAVGDQVRSPAAGVVTFSGPVAGRPVVTVDHGGGWRTSLEPVRAVVPVGARVASGSVLGTVDGAPGHCAPRTCLHVGVRRGAAGDGYVDPLSLMGAVRVVLLPTGR